MGGFTDFERHSPVNRRICGEIITASLQCVELELESMTEEDNFSYSQFYSCRRNWFDFESSNQKCSYTGFL